MVFAVQCCAGRDVELEVRNGRGLLVVGLEWVGAGAVWWVLLGQEVGGRRAVVKWD